LNKCKTRVDAPGNKNSNTNEFMLLAPVS